MAEFTYTDTTIFRPSGDVVSCDLGDGKALLNLVTNRYFKLNDSAKVMWAAIEQGATLSGIIARVMEHFDVDQGRCTADVTITLKAFSEAKLLETDPAESE